MERVADLDAGRPEPPAVYRASAAGVSGRIPAALLWAEDPGAVPDDASAAAHRHLRAEVLEAVERVTATPEGWAADLPPAVPPDL